MSYWSENPPSEAEYINLTIGSLLREDLRDLEDMGLIPEEDDDEKEAKSSEAVAGRHTALRQSFGVPWFDGLVEGTRLGNMRRRQGVQRSQDGRVNIEWEIVEYSGNEGSGAHSADAEGEDVEMELSNPGKRKLEDRDEANSGTQQGN